jgi:hypothetical protein
MRCCSRSPTTCRPDSGAARSSPDSRCCPGWPRSALARTGTAADRDPTTAVHAFAVTTAALAGIGVLAILAGHQATQSPAAPATQEQPLDLAETELTAP